MKTAIPILAIATCFFITAGCSSQPKQFTERKLVIRNKETVKIKELDLSITNNGCGRQWISEKDQPSHERAYCELVIKRKDSTIHLGTSSKIAYLGNIEIKIDRMNPWGAEEDSIPPYGCRVWVRRVEGR